MRVLPLLAVAAIAAGCGSGGGPAFDDELAKAEAVVTEALTDLGSDSGELEASSKAIAGAARELAASKPGGGEKRVHAQVVDGFRKVAATLHQAAVAGSNGEFAKRDALLEHLDTSPGMRELEAAERDLEKLSG